MSISTDKQPEQGGINAAGLGAVIRKCRDDKGITLDDLARRAGCAKSYLSMLENGRRGAGASRRGAGAQRLEFGIPDEEPAVGPNPALLQRLELALGVEPGSLVRAAEWAATPPAIKQEVEQLRRAAAAPGMRRVLDEMYGSGELRRMVEEKEKTQSEKRKAQIEEEDQPFPRPLPSGEGCERGELGRVLPLQVPLINRVAAGYPREFTDLGYPARVADEYVRAIDVGDADAFAARVVGDSMEPEYREGDIVVFSPLREVKSGMDCFVRMEGGGETTFKRVFLEVGRADAETANAERGTRRKVEAEIAREPDAGSSPSSEFRVPSSIRLVPLNAKYPERLVRREEVAGMYAAVSVTREVRSEK